MILDLSSNKPIPKSSRFHTWLMDLVFRRHRVSFHTLCDARQILKTIIPDDCWTSQLGYGDRFCPGIAICTPYIKNGEYYRSDHRKPDTFGPFTAVFFAFITGMDEMETVVYTLDQVKIANEGRLSKLTTVLCVPARFRMTEAVSVAQGLKALPLPNNVDEEELAEILHSTWSRMSR